MPDFITEELGKVVTTFRAGGTPKADSDEYYGGDIPFVMIEDITACSKYLDKTAKTLSRKGLAASAAWLVPAGHILYSMYATLGKARINTIPVATNQAIAAMAANKRLIETEYLLYALSSLEDQIHRFTSQTTQSNLNGQTVKRLRVSFPADLAVQRRIAKILTTVDNQIEKTEALIAKYQSIKQGMTHDMLARGMDADGGLSASETTGEFPARWQFRKLADLAAVGSGVTLGRNLKGAGIVELPYLRVANVQDGFVDLTEVKTVTVFRGEIERFQLQAGDVLATEGGDFDKLGRGTVWRGQVDPCLHQNHIFRIRFDQTQMLPEFFAIISGSAYGRRYFLLCSKQTTNLASVNSTQLKAFPVPVPPLTEQRAIVDALAAIERRTAYESAHLHKLRNIKLGLMQDLLTGRVSVKPEHSDQDHGDTPNGEVRAGVKPRAEGVHA